MADLIERIEAARTGVHVAAAIGTDEALLPAINALLAVSKEAADALAARAQGGDACDRELLQRLRDRQKFAGLVTGPLLDEAADEIERLQSFISARTEGWGEDLRVAAKEGMRLLRINGYEAAADEIETALSTPQPDAVREWKRILDKAIRFGADRGHRCDIRIAAEAVSQSMHASLSAQGAAGAGECTCPSGDGSLRWPCPQHPPQDERGEVRLG